MIDTFHNLMRRKVRTSLTILGIMVGTLALTVMGAMSEKINLLVDGAVRYYNTRVVVQPKETIPGQLLGPPLSVDIISDIQEVPGVDAAFPSVYLLYQEEEEGTPSISIGFPPLIIGVDARRFSYERDENPVVLSHGRFILAGEEGVALIGVDLAASKDVSLGSTVKVRGRDFEIVGTIARTLTARDNIIFVPLPEAQEFLSATLPPPFNKDPYALASEIEVYPADLSQADAVAEGINRRIAGVRARAPGDIEGEIRQSLVIFNVIIIGSAAIAVVVGGLSILNTMAMAVTERTREIRHKEGCGRDQSRHRQTVPPGGGGHGVRRGSPRPSSPSEDYLTVLAGQRQWIATTNFAGCPGRPPDSFANSAVLTTSAKVSDALGWPIDPCIPVQIDPKAEQFEQVVACADQRPFAVHLLQSPQQELPESPALLDLAEYRLHSLHPQSVALPTPPGL